MADKDSGCISEGFPCGCADHFGALYMDTVFKMEIDYIFECLFENSEFYQRLNEARNVRVYDFGDWQETVVDGKSLKQRKLLSNIKVQSTIGSKSFKYTETLTILTCKVGSMYVVDSETISYGIPLVDNFKVKTKMCLLKVTEGSTRVIGHSGIEFIKNPFDFIKKLTVHNCAANFKKTYIQLGEFFLAESIKRQEEAARRQLVASSDQSLLTNQSEISSSANPTSLASPNRNVLSEDSFSSVPTVVTPLRQRSNTRDRGQTSQDLRRETPYNVPNNNDASITAQGGVKILLASKGDPTGHTMYLGLETNMNPFHVLIFLILLGLLVFNVVLFMKMKEIEKMGDILRNELRYYRKANK